MKRKLVITFALSHWKLQCGEKIKDKLRTLQFEFYFSIITSDQTRIFSHLEFNNN